MRRRIVHLAVGSAIALLTTGTLGASNRRLIERRLLGTWRSDRDRTVAQWKYDKEVAEDVRERFEKIFGKFTLRFTETHIHSEYEGVNDVVPYSVVAHDSTSVVIAWHEKKGRSLQQIHFEGDGYYILSGYNVEFYKRIS